MTRIEMAQRIIRNMQNMRPISDKVVDVIVSDSGPLQATIKMADGNSVTVNGLYASKLKYCND